MNGNGSFGTWLKDKYGLPAYNYTCNQFLNPFAKTPTTYGFSVDHFHQIGNDRITATVHNGGYIQVLECSRGFQWLTYKNKKKNKLGGGIALFQADQSQPFLSDLYKLKSSQLFTKFQRIFGMGYFQKKLHLDNLRIEHNICAPFSDDAIFVSEIIVSNESETQFIENLKLIDFWDVFLHHILRSLIVTSNKRKTFGRTKLLNATGRVIKFLQKITKTDTEGSRNKFDKKFNFKLDYDKSNNTIIITPKYRKKNSVKISVPAKHNYYPKSIFLSMIQGEPQKVFLNQEQIVKRGKFSVDWDSPKFSIQKSRTTIKNPCAGIGTELTINPQEIKNIVCIFGYGEIENIENLISNY